MWDLFDFNNDGKVDLEEKVIGIQLVEGTLFPEETASNDDLKFDEEDFDTEPDNDESEF